jgi:hypothetical protein
MSRLFVAIAVILICTNRIYAVSTFDQDAEQWKIVDLNPGGSYTTLISVLANPAIYSNIGGNPEGCIYWTDNTPNAFYFEAPAKFIGNQSSAYGLNLTFDIWTDENDWPFDPLVVLVGNNATLIYSLPKTPIVNTWNNYTVPMEENAWRFDGLSGTVPSQLDFQGVLSSLTALRICGEFGSQIVETTRLDNVNLPTVPEPSSLVLLGMGAISIAGYAWRKYKLAR